MAVPKSKQKHTETKNRQPVNNAPENAQVAPQQPPTECQNKKSNNKWWHTNDFPMLIVTFFGVLAVVAYTCVTRQQLNAFFDQLTLSFPPKIVVKQVSFWPAGMKGATVDLNARCGDKPCELDGELWVINLGHENVSTGAGKGGFRCLTYWSSNNLPMIPPYLFDNFASDPRRCGLFMKLPDFKEEAIILRPGEIAKSTFKTTIPADYSASMKFYVMGIAVYIDRLGTPRPSLFARWYDPTSHRFVAEKDNPDYEGYE